VYPDAFGHGDLTLPMADVMRSVGVRLYAGIAASIIAHTFGLLCAPFGFFIALSAQGDDNGPGVAAWCGGWTLLLVLWIAAQAAFLKLGSKWLLPVRFPATLLAVGATAGVLAGFFVVRAFGTKPSASLGDTAAVAITFISATVAASAVTLFAQEQLRSPEAHRAG
jgi:hypothetical protein